MEDLTVHHIVPQKVRVDNTPPNLAVLCIDCHALVERHYWREMALAVPQAAALYKEACRVFWDRRATKKRRSLAMDTQAITMGMLQTGISDWHALYVRALEWTQTVKPVRRVDPGSAIMSEPWWTVK